uniref:ATP-binding protein n=1 Tax=Flavobacterium sp. TaxID=239 RepID=UPI00404B4E15
MINKRLLIKNLLTHHDENSFYDKKRQLNLHTKEGKAKFLKHICALSNANPSNNSYIVVGVEDESNEMVGDDFFDDSRIQNLVDAYLEHPPKILYENVPFPNLIKGKVIGLVTIKPSRNISYFKKNIHTIYRNMVFIRQGSNSIPVENQSVMENLRQKEALNTQTVIEIENNSRNNIELTLDGVMDFMHVRHKGLNTNYKVFKEMFIVCWAGNKKKIRDKILYSRVDIELINEQVKLFYSALDEVSIFLDADTFQITEFIPLGLNDRTSYYPLEQLTIRFHDNGHYEIDTVFLFEPPEFNKKMLHHIYNATLSLLAKIKNNVEINNRQKQELISVPETLMICYLNGFSKAKGILIESKELFKRQTDPQVFTNFKETMRILRKVKYDKD